MKLFTENVILLSTIEHNMHYITIIIDEYRVFHTKKIIEKKETSNYFDHHLKKKKISTPVGEYLTVGIEAHKKCLQFTHPLVFPFL